MLYAPLPCGLLGPRGPRLTPLIVRMYDQVRSGVAASHVARGERTGFKLQRGTKQLVDVWFLVIKRT